MKLRASVNKLNKKVIFILMGAVGLIFTALRFYQMNKLTDPETGFFTDMTHITVVLYYVLWFVTVLSPMLLCYLSSQCKSGAFAGGRSIFLSLCSLVMGAGALTKALSVYREVSAGASSMMLGILRYAKEGKAYIELVGVVLGVLAAIVFAVNAISLLTGSKLISSLKFCQLIPALWLFTVTVTHFKVNVSYFNVTQLMLQIFADAFLMLFMFEFARFISGIGITEADWLVYASGITALILLCAASLPNLMLFIGGHSEKLVSHCPFEWYSIAAVLYVLAALITLALNKSKEAISIEPVELSGGEESASEE